MPIQTVTIVGVGLIGGSFGLALRKHGFVGRILGVSSARTLEAALERGAIDEGVNLESGVGQADLIYLSQPISQILDGLPRIAKLARPGALVTDAGSTKAAIVERAAQYFGDDPCFIGGHPMAGKEKSGVERADPDLFQQAVYVLTPAGETMPQTPVVADFQSWLGRIGARVVVLPAGVHDEVVTWTSHLPQLIASALASTVAEQVPAGSCRQVAGPGLQDMTRLAESPFEIWRDILGTNWANVDRALSVFLQQLRRFQEQLAGPGLAEEFRAAKEARRELRPKPET